MSTQTKKEFDFSEKIGLDYLRSRSPTAYIPKEALAEAHRDNAEDIAKLGSKGLRWPTYSESNTTLAANLAYSFIKDLEREEDFSKYKRYPIKRWGFLTETNSDGGIPDLEYAFGVVTSRLLQEDEAKYRPIVESTIRKTWIIPITFNCGSGGLMYNVFLPAIACEMDGSAAFISVDTSAYDKNYSGKNAYRTVGSNATLGTLTPESDLMFIDRKASATYHINEFGFTKFLNKHIPKTNPISQITYDYIGIKTYIQLEAKYNLKDIEFGCIHTPFVEQPKTYFTLPYVHITDQYNPEEMKAITLRIGQKDLGGYKHFAEMLDDKFTKINRNGENITDQKIMESITNDPQIGGHLAWLKKVRKQPEFEAYLEKLHVNEALKNNEERGNSYADATFDVIGGLLEHGTIRQGMKGLTGFFGSGGVWSLYGSQIASEPKDFRKNKLFIDHNSRVELTSTQYLWLYNELLLDEGKRTTTGEDLIEKDRKFLNVDKLTQGFHIRKRFADGTGEWVFVDEDGKEMNVPRRY